MMNSIIAFLALLKLANSIYLGNPTFLSQFTYPNMISSWIRITSDGTTAYLTSNNNGYGFYVLSLSGATSGSTPTYLSNYAGSVNCQYHIFVLSSDESKAYIVDNYNGGGLVALDLTNVKSGNTPTLIYNYNTNANYYRSVALSPDETTAYVCDNSNGLFILNIQTTPFTLLNTYTRAKSTGFQYITLSSDGNTGFISETGWEIQIVNLTGSTSGILPTLIKTYLSASGKIGFWGLAVSPDQTRLYGCNYGGGSLEIIDISTLSSPTIINSFIDPNAASTKYSFVTLSPSGDIAYLIDSQSSNGLYILNVSGVTTTTAPSVIGTFNDTGTGETIGQFESLAIDTDGQTLLVADFVSGNGIWVLQMNVCGSNSDCTSSSLPYCDSSTGQCVACFSNSECTQSTASACSSSYSCIPCTTNSECSSQSGTTCSNGECVAGDGCTTSNCENQVEASKTLSSFTSGVVTSTQVVSVVATVASPAMLGGVMQRAQNFYYLLLINTQLPANLNYYLNGFSTGALGYFQFYKLYNEDDKITTPERFSNQGLNSLFYSNFSPTLFLVTIWVPLLVLAKFLRGYTSRMHKHAKTVYDKIDAFIFWSGTFSIININIFNLFLFSSVQIRYAVFNTVTDVFSYLTAFMIYFTCCGYIYWNWYIMKHHGDDKEYLENNYKSIVDNVRIEGKCKYLNVVVLARCCIVSFALGFLQDIPILQLLVICSANGSVLYYHLKFRPYTEMLEKFQALFDESILLFVCLLCFAFIGNDSAGYFDGNQSVALGTVLITFVTLNTLVNLIICAIKGIQAFRDFLRGKDTKKNPKIIPEQAKKIQAKDILPVEQLLDFSPQPMIRKPKIKHMKIIDAEVQEYVELELTPMSENKGPEVTNSFDHLKLKLRDSNLVSPQTPEIQNSSSVKLNSSKNEVALQDVSSESKGIRHRTNRRDLKLGKAHSTEPNQVLQYFYINIINSQRSIYALSIIHAQFHKIQKEIEKILELAHLSIKIFGCK